MPDEATISVLTQSAMERSERNITIWTTFLQEASVLVLVFGILDTYAANRLTVTVGFVVGILGLALLGAAFAVRQVFRWFIRRSVVSWLTLQEQSGAGGMR